jgi:hypothetical protein
VRRWRGVPSAAAPAAHRASGPPASACRHRVALALHAPPAARGGRVHPPSRCTTAGTRAPSGGCASLRVLTTGANASCPRERRRLRLRRAVPRAQRGRGRGTAAAVTTGQAPPQARTAHTGTRSTACGAAPSSAPADADRGHATAGGARTPAPGTAGIVRTFRRAGVLQRRVQPQALRARQRRGSCAAARRARPEQLNGGSHPLATRAAAQRRVRRPPPRGRPPLRHDDEHSRCGRRQRQRRRSSSGSLAACRQPPLPRRGSACTRRRGTAFRRVRRAIEDSQPISAPTSCPAAARACASATRRSAAHHSHGVRGAREHAPPGAARRSQPLSCAAASSSTSSGACARLGAVDGGVSTRAVQHAAACGASARGFRALLRPACRSVCGAARAARRCSRC